VSPLNRNDIKFGKDLGLALSLVGIAAGLFFLLILANVWSPRKKVQHEIVSLYDAEDPNLRRTMGSLMGPSILPGNRVTGLNNGEEIFPAMLKAIRNAKNSITFETFIYWSGKVGKAFAEALAERSNHGVRVYVLLDWIGSRALDAESVKIMTDAGVKVEKFNPLRWYNIFRLNNRTHRKIMVVDGKIGFIGGACIADQWSGDARNPNEWRDIHYQLEGPVVAQLQAAFLDNWHANHHEILHGDDFFPELFPAGDLPAQVFRSSPEEGSGSLRLMYLLSIAAARKSLRIGMAYFVPDRLAMKMLIRAAARGVKVEIIVPGPHMDVPFSRRASRSKWGRLLKAGIDIYEFQPTMYHCKFMIVDEVWVSVGSANFDNRSFRLNREANLNIYDQEFARQHVAVFERDKVLSRKITHSIWKRRPRHERVEEFVATLVESQL
jgi:cardiolipin synthase A/B